MTTQGRSMECRNQFVMNYWVSSHMNPSFVPKNTRVVSISKSRIRKSANWVNNY
uniref:Uncharacterized protein n=1 Tax=Arundo donax TaxID=35708 RepID=A0A0A9C087_ARUDO